VLQLEHWVVANYEHVTQAQMFFDATHTRTSTSLNNE